MGSIMNGGGGATLISGSGTLINAKNVGKTMPCLTPPRSDPPFLYVGPREHWLLLLLL
jgi:hypothetical protein